MRKKIAAEMREWQATKQVFHDVETTREKIFFRILRANSAGFSEDSRETFFGIKKLLKARLQVV